MSKIISAIISGATSLGKIVERLFTSELVLVAGNCPEVLATARYWREQLDQARVHNSPGEAQDLQIEVLQPLTKSELDDFEKALATEIARAKIYCHDSPVFTARGQEFSAHLICAALAVEISDKICYWGYMTRMRVLPGQVDREVGHLFDYGQGNWHNVWTRA